MNAASGSSHSAKPAEAIGEEHWQAENLAQPQHTAQPATDVRVVTKFLISNAAAGSVIGRAGTNITDYQTQSGARIQLSRSGEWFPGTNDRVMLLAGTSPQVILRREAEHSQRAGSAVQALL